MSTPETAVSDPDVPVTPNASHFRPLGGRYAHRFNQRYLRAALTSAVLLFSRGAGSALNLILIPMAFRHLGPERFGMWMTVTSIVTFLSMANLGIDKGMLNIVAAAVGRNDLQRVQQAISSAGFLLLGIAALLSLCFAVAYPLLEWQRLFNVASPIAIAESAPVVLLFAVSFLISIPLALVRDVQSAYQEGFFSGIWEGIGKLAAFLLALVAIEFKAGTPAIVGAIAFGPVLGLLGNAISFFGFRRPELRPRWSLFNADLARSTIALGGSFFVLQIGVAVAFTSDNFVIAQTLGSAQVAQYSVPSTLFTLCSALMGIALMPLWPAYAEAHAGGDSEWVLRTLRRTFGYSVGISALSSGALAACAPFLIRHWVSSSVVPSRPLLTGLAVWSIMTAAGTAVGIYFNGVGVIRFQVLSTVALSLLAIPMKVLFIRMTNSVSGAVWGTIASYTICFIVPVLFYMRSGMPGARAIPGKEA